MGIALPKRIDDNIDQFTGRAWLLPKILDWWENRKEERLFLLTGGPGTGKSMILAWLANHGPLPADPAAVEQLTKLRQVTKAAHFCQADSRNVSPQAFAQNIVNQLTESVKGFGAALAATLAERVSIVGTVRAETATDSTLTGVSIGRIDLGTLGDELSFDRAFTEPLMKLYKSGYNEPMLLLVDALDEAQYYTGTTIPDLLSRLSDLPKQIRILATTRDEPRVLTFFHDIKPFDLIKDADSNANDVFIYAKGRLAKLDTVDKVQREGFAQRLSTQSAGIFLYAALVLDELLTRPPNQLPKLDTYSLPNGLSGLYHNFLVRELGTEDKGRRWHRIYKLLLGLIAVAQGDGLTARQLTTLIGQDVAEPLDACKQYLSGDLPDGPFKPFHKSFTDFLLEDKRNVRYHVDASFMHARIAKHYWSKHHKEWSQCEGYGLDHLAVHLFHGHQFDRLEQLISPEWMSPRVNHWGYRYSGFIADLMLAWQCAQEKANRQIEANDESFTAFATCFRYALIRTSINSLSSNYSPALITRALDTRIWTVERALDICAHQPDAQERIELLQGLLEANNTVFSESARHRVEQTALITVMAIADEGSRARGLAALAPQLSGERLAQAVTAATAIADERSRAQALTALAPQLSETMRTLVLEKALITVMAIADEGSRARALVALAPQLSGERLAQAVTAATAIEDERSRAQALTALAPQLSETMRAPVLERALVMAMEIQDGLNCARVLAILAGQLSETMRTPVLERAVTTAMAIEDERSRARALTALAPKLTEGQLMRAMDAATAITHEEYRIRVLEALAPHLSGTQLEAALAVATTSKHEGSRVRVLEALAPHLSGAQLEEALAAAIAIEHEQSRVRVLEALAPNLSGTQLEEAFVAATAIKDKGHRDEALMALAPHLSGRQLEAALVAATVIKDEGSRARVLGALVPHLHEDQLEVVLAAAKLIKHEGSRAKVLMALAPHLNGRQIEAAFVATVVIENEWSRGEVLTNLAPYLNDRQIEAAFAATVVIENEWSRAEVLRALAPHLSGTQLEAALTAAIAIEFEGSRVRVLEALAPHLSGTQLETAFVAATAIKDKGYRDEALMVLAPHLHEDQLKITLAADRMIKHERRSAEMMIALAPQRDKGKRTTVAENGDIRGMIRHRLIDLVEREGEQDSRAGFLRSVFATDRIRPPIIGAETVGVILQHIIEISERWRWV